MSDRKAASGTSSKPRWSTRQLATMALMLAIGVILSFIEFPLLPGTDFLKFDASFVPSSIIGFTFGPVAGCIVGVLVAGVHAIISGNFWGGLMNAIIVIAFVLPAAAIYRKKKGTVAVIVGLVISLIAAVIVALVLNLLITPIYMTPNIMDAAAIAQTREQRVIPMLLFPILPFNILKGAINVVITFILQRSLRTFLEKGK